MAACEAASPLSVTTRSAASPAATGTFRRPSPGGSGSEGASPAAAASPSASSASRRRRQRLDAEEPFEDIIASLTRQKEELRRTQPSPARPAKSRSAPALLSPEVPQQLNSNWRGSAAYSWGRPRHTRGSFGLEVLGPRDLEYVPPSGGIAVPGAGAYNFSHADGKDLAETDGHTGGWPHRQHALFLSTLREHKGVASPEFFDRLVFLMPELPRKAFTDHLRWMADFDHTSAKKHRKVLRFKEENRTGESPPEDRKEQWLDWRRARSFQQQADAEDARHGLRDREVLFQSHQRDHLGQHVGGNLRGHPQFRRSPGFCFGRELRDVDAKRHTDLAHVRSSSAMDVPGPGAYCGLAEKEILLRSAPAASLRDKLPAQKVDPPAVGGPGYDGPLDGGVRVQRELRLLQNRSPEWAFPREQQRAEHCSNERKALRDKFSTEALVGPGRYEHATSFHTKFPK